MSPNSEEWKSRCVGEIWGLGQEFDDADMKEVVSRLERYFIHYENHLPQLSPESSKTANEEDHFRLLRYIKLLRLNPEVSRESLRHGVLSLASQEARYREDGDRGHLSETQDQGSASGNRPARSITSGPYEQSFVRLPPGTIGDHLLPESSKGDRHRSLFDRSIAGAARAVFGISVYHRSRYEEGERQVGQSSCLWEDDMSLKALLEREFPINRRVDQLSGRFKERLVSLRNLSQHADIKIVWTNHLPDHLLLTYNEKSKVLALFGLPSMIDISYDACQGAHTSLRDDESYSCHGTKK
ncbi:hypothetical protein CSOJ01_15963 [Colletotrichum sojae]|uniref:Uncharacterized protein n=1 Tax=Colletotrichum sojae TaxID=2175907 RepID=A0A8H6ILT7_9PEZI|nr:hypothetical protein CSOJ01_15963 [Colletotrichum sojae]